MRQPILITIQKSYKISTTKNAQISFISARCVLRPRDFEMRIVLWCYCYTERCSIIENDVVDDGSLKHGRVDFSSDICWPIESRSIFVMGVLKKKRGKEGRKKRKVEGKRKMSDGRNEIRHRPRRYFIVPDDQSRCEIPGLFARRSHYKLKKLPSCGVIFSGVVSTPPCSFIFILCSLKMIFFSLANV